MVATLIIGLLAVLLAYLDGKEILRDGLKYAFLLLTVFLAIRYDWGNDYPSYLQSFKDYNRYDVGLFDFDIFTELRPGEEGWVFLCKLFKPIGFFGMIIVLSVFENCVIYKLIKKYVSKNWYWLAVLIFVFNPALMITGSSMMRQYLAVCLYIIAIKFILERRLLLFVLTIVLSSKIHSSSLLLLITLPLFYLTNKNQNKSIRTFIYLTIGYVLWLNIGPVIFERLFADIISFEIFSKYSYYVGNMTISKADGMQLGVLLFHILFIILLYYQYVLNRTLHIFFYLFSISFLLMPLVSIVPMVARFSYYFSLFGVICYPSFLCLIKDEKIKLFILLAIFIILIKSYWTFFHSEIWFEHFYTYKTIFSALSWM